MKKILLPVAMMTLLVACGEDDKKSSDDSKENKETVESEGDEPQEVVEENVDVEDLLVMSYYDDEGGQVYATPSEKEMFGGKRFDKAYPFKDGMAKVGKEAGNGYKYTFINDQGEEISDYKYFDLGYFHDGMVWYQLEKDGMYGYLNSDGEEVLPAQYMNKWDFKNGLALISNKAYNQYMSPNPEILYGYINVKGDTIIPMEYMYARSFGDGLAPVFDGKDLIYIDTTGAQAIDTKFENGEQFAEGMAPVQFDGKIGFINPEGEYILEPQFDNYKFMFKYADFSEYFDQNERTYTTDDGLMIVAKGDKWGIINKQNEPIVDFTYADIDIPKGDYVKVKTIKKKEAYSTKYYQGLYDLKNKKEAVPAKYDEVSEFYLNDNGWMKVGMMTKADAYKADVYGFYNAKNGKSIEPAYDDVNNFSEGLAAVEKNEKWGYVNEEGELVIDFKFDYPDEFEEGKAFVKMGEEYVNIDQKGNVIED